MANFLRGGLAAWLALLAACGGEPLTSPPNQLPTKPSLDSTRLTAPSNPLLTVTRSNLNVCSEGTPTRATNGRVKSWVRQSRRVNVRSAARDTAIAEYHAMAFSDDGKQLVDVQCVFARGDSASAFIREYFSRTAFHPNGGGVGEGQDFLILPPNLYCANGSGTTIDCYFFGSHVVCTPTVVAEQMRVGPGPISSTLGRPFAFAAMDDPGAYNCAFVVDPPSSGGGSAPTSSNAGTISYIPPDGSPPTGFGGGVLPGGDYYYVPPTNTNCFLGGCSGNGGGPCYATLRSLNAGFSTLALDCTPPPCEARTDPNCLRGILAPERALLDSAVTEFFADTTTIADPVQRYECTLVGQWTKQLVASADLYIGNYHTFTVLDGHGPNHLAQTTGDSVHIDVEVLGAHRGDIAVTVMHEAVHRFGRGFVADHGGDRNLGILPDYSLPFWRSVEANVESKSCHKPYQ